MGMSCNIATRRAREPSASDVQLTCRTKDLIDEIDVRLLDHIVVSPTKTVSMAARSVD